MFTINSRENHSQSSFDEYFKYKTELCRYYAKGYCNAEDECKFAHGKKELAGNYDGYDSYDEKPQTKKMPVPVEKV